MGPFPTSAVSAPRTPWWRRHVRLEDLALAAWMVVVIPLSGATPGTAPGGGTDPVFGFLDLAGLLAFAVCVGARSAPGIKSGLVAAGDLRYAVGPLVGAVAFTLDDLSERLGLADGLGALPILLAAAVGILARFRLSPLSAPQRRALVTPFVLVTSRFFSQVLGGLTGLFDLRQLAAAGATPGGFGEAALVIGFATAGIAIFYVMLVFAPRQIAELEGTPTSWVVRFVLFVASLAVGTTLGGLVHPA